MFKGLLEVVAMVFGGVDGEKKNEGDTWDIRFEVRDVGWCVDWEKRKMKGSGFREREGEVEESGGRLRD